MTSPTPQPANTVQQLQAELEWQLEQNLELRGQLEMLQAQARSAGLVTSGSGGSHGAAESGEAAQLQPLLRLLLAPDDQPTAFTDAGPALALAGLDQAWQQLRHGHRAAASSIQQQLQAHPDPLGPHGLQQLDQLSRVLATQHWLQHHGDAAPAQYSGGSECGLRMALDQLAISSCRRVLMLEGWCIDPALQLAALYLCHGPQAWPLPLAWLQRHPRADLTPLLEQQGLPAHTPAGLRLASPLPPRTSQAAEANAAPPEPFALLAVLHNGRQFCLAPPLAADPLPWPALIAYLDTLLPIPQLSINN